MKLVLHDILTKLNNIPSLDTFVISSEILPLSSLIDK
jgi:hypothetical protein